MFLTLVLIYQLFHMVSYKRYDSWILPFVRAFEAFMTSIFNDVKCFALMDFICFYSISVPGEGMLPEMIM